MQTVSSNGELVQALHSSLTHPLSPTQQIKSLLCGKESGQNAHNYAPERLTSKVQASTP